jgi:ferredoxin
MVISAESIKRMAKDYGADLVGVSGVERFEGTPKNRDPRFIAPAAKSVVGLGFRVLRGSLRGVEEGTQFHQFSEMGVVHIDEVLAPTVLRRITCALEDAGYEGVPLRSEPDRQPASFPGTNPEHAPTIGLEAVPVSPGKPAPDVLVDFRQAAVACGLAELGKGGFLLTREFGPLQRFAFLLTDAPLEADELRGEGLCDGCGDCMAACPGKAYAYGTEASLELGALRRSFVEPDSWQCAAFYMGANPAKNPFLSDAALAAMPLDAASLSGDRPLGEAGFRSVKAHLDAAYPGMRFGYNASVCGRSCWRACLASLERRGQLGGRFASPFRTKPEWELKR